MSKLEDTEITSCKSEMARDVEALVDKYRAIFSWDVPEVDMPLAEDLIFTEMRLVLQRLSERKEPIDSGGRI